MTRISWRFLAVIVSLIAVLVVFAYGQSDKGGGFAGTSTQVGWYENSYAFVVEINSYSQGWGRLYAGVSDAKKMTEALRQQGFTVYLVPVEARSGDTTSYIPMNSIRTEIMNNCAVKHVHTAVPHIHRLGRGGGGVGRAAAGNVDG